ncbi:hypothetical protein KKH30_00115 [Candidatus Micrarchaeota archaeon]|nr:hypothetical protein [Candidatus Micrarchaeota archaeon]
MAFNIKGTLLGGVLGGIAVLIIGFVFNFIWGIIFPGYMETIAGLGGMRAMNDPMMMLFMFGQPFVLAFAMAIAYNWLKPGCVCGKSGKCNVMCEGAMYGLLIWVVAQVPAAFLIYTSMDYPLFVVFSWVFMPLFTYPAAGAVIAKFMK